MEKCLICGKEFKNISYHFSIMHKIDYVKYLVNHKLIKIPKCKVCNENINVFSGRGRNLILKNPKELKYCSNKCKFSDNEYNKSRVKKIKNDEKTQIVCNLCKWTSKDINNLSGALTIHLKEQHNLIYEKKYFNVMETEKIEYWNCPMCRWRSKDLINISGAITLHIKNIHNMTMLEFYNKFPDKLINTKILDKEKLIKESNISCKLCGEKMLIISNTHLKNKHAMTQKKYKEMFGSNITSDYMKKILKSNGGIKEDKFISNAENEIKKLLEETYKLTVIQTYKKLGVEYDLFIPNKQILIEYNGLYWHSELRGKNKNYHLDKTKIAERNNIHLIHIFEDEWINKQEIVKNRLKHILNINNGGDKIYARNCVIKEIDKKSKKEFLIKNHIQGDDKASICLGAFYNNELVAVMTFGIKRKALGSNNVSGEYELYRFSTNMNYRVVGIAGKLSQYFIKNYNPEKIISYADRRWTYSKNSVYEKIGFKLISETKPNYFYMKKYGKRLHRFNFTKQRIIEKFGGIKEFTEWENMQLLGYDRIWDCGNLKYEWLNNSTEKMELLKMKKV